MATIIIPLNECLLCDLRKVEVGDTVLIYLDPTKFTQAVLDTYSPVSGIVLVVRGPQGEEPAEASMVIEVDVPDESLPPGYINLEADDMERIECESCCNQLSDAIDAVDAKVDAHTEDLANPHQTDWDSLVGKPTEFPPSSHAASHGVAGGDPITINYSQISNPPAALPPTAHALTHSSAGADPVFDQDLNVADSPEFAAMAAGGVVFKDSGVIKGAALGTADGVVIAHTDASGTYDPLDGGVAMLTGVVELHGGVANVQSLADPVEGKDRSVRCDQDGNLYSVTLEASGWELNDTSTGVYNIGEAGDANPNAWTKLTNGTPAESLETTATDAVAPGERVDFTVRMWLQELGAKNGSVQIGVGIDGVEPQTWHTVAVSKSANGYYTINTTTTTATIDIGHVLAVWARPVFVGGGDGSFEIEVDGAEGIAEMTIRGGGSGVSVGQTSSESEVYATHIGHTGVANGGGILSINADPTKFDISDGFGYVLDLVSDPENPTRTLVSWESETAISVPNLLTSNLSFIGIDINGDVVQQTGQFTEAQHRSIIILGVLTHTGAVVTTTGDDSTPLDGYLSDSLARAIGNINREGNGYMPAASDLTISHEAGLSFFPNINRGINPLDPDNLVTGAEASITYLYVYNDGSGGATVSVETAIIPDKWDDGSGTLADVDGSPGEKWTNQLAYFFPSSGIYLIRPGTELFNKDEDALFARNTIPTPIGTGIDPELVRTIITVKHDATDLTDTGKAIFNNTGKFGLGAGGSGGGSASGFSTVTKETFTVATLPTPEQGMSCYVSDASVTLAAGIGTTVAGGGANYCPVHYNGSNWIIG